MSNYKDVNYDNLTRVKLVFGEGTKQEQMTYGYMGFDDNGGYMMLNKERWNLSDLAKTEVTAVSTLPDVSKILIKHGFKVRPLTKQTLMSVSVAPSTKERLQKARKKEGRSMSDIIENVVIDWLNEKGY